MTISLGLCTKILKEDSLYICIIKSDVNILYGNTNIVQYMYIYIILNTLILHVSRLYLPLSDKHANAGNVLFQCHVPSGKKLKGHLST